MGVIFSGFKKKKDIKDRLEEIDKELKYIYRYQATNRSSQQALLSKFLWNSFVFTIIYIFVGYVFYFPISLEEQIYAALIYLVFILCFYFLKTVAKWFYQSRIIRKDALLKELKQEKEQILEDVLDNEKFKVAKEILEKYAPEKLRDHIYSFTRELEDVEGENDESTVNKNSDKSPEDKAKPQNTTDMRQRSLSSRGLSNSMSNLSNLPQKPQTAVMPMYSNLSKVPATSTPVLNRIAPRAPNPIVFLPRDRRNTMPHISAVPHLNQPLMQGERKQSYVDLFLEMITGEGPRNRFALICQKCHFHNGMAIKEEFEYLSFRCVSCNYLNPSRKSRTPLLAINSFEESGSDSNERKTDTEENRKSGLSAPHLDDKWKGSSTSLLHQTVEEEEDQGSSTEEEQSAEDVSEPICMPPVSETPSDSPSMLVGKETSL